MNDQQRAPVDPLAQDTATTRELPLAAPTHPRLTAPLLVVQIAFIVAGGVLIGIQTLPLVGLILAVVGALGVLLTRHRWQWVLMYRQARLLTAAQVNRLQPGNWVVAPGSRYAVQIRNPSGAARNPTIADGLTRGELEIIAPVYRFSDTPSGAKQS